MQEVALGGLAQDPCMPPVAKTYSVVDEVFASLRAGCPPPPMAAAADEAVEGQDVTVAHHLA